MNVLFASHIVVVIMAITLVGCSSTQGVYTDQPPPVSTVQVNDGQVSVVTGNSLLPLRSLNQIGSEVEAKDGETLRLGFEGFDPTSAVIVSQYDARSKTLKMNVVNRRNLVLLFTSPCQTIRVGNMTTLPSFEVAPGLPVKQIVVTPLCDGNGKITGFEYRYGSSTNGCGAEAKSGLAAFQRCAGVGRPPTGVQHGLTDAQKLCIFFDVCK